MLSLLPALYFVSIFAHDTQFSTCSSHTLSYFLSLPSLLSFSWSLKNLYFFYYNCFFAKKSHHTIQVFRIVFSFSMTTKRYSLTTKTTLPGLAVQCSCVQDPLDSLDVATTALLTMTTAVSLQIKPHYLA